MRVTYKFLIGFLLLLATLGLYFMPRKNEQIKQEIENLIHKELRLDTSKMQFFAGQDLMSDHLGEKMKIVVFLDSVACSTCELNAISQWDIYKEGVTTLNHRLGFYFILQPSISEYKNLVHKIKEAHFRSEFYVDTCQIFTKTNPYIPKSRFLHTFLLDSLNHVILIGNPHNNARLESLYLREIKKRFRSELQMQ